MTTRPTRDKSKTKNVPATVALLQLYTERPVSNQETEIIIFHSDVVGWLCPTAGRVTVGRATRTTTRWAPAVIYSR